MMFDLLTAMKDATWVLIVSWETTAMKTFICTERLHDNNMLIMIFSTVAIKVR